MYCLLPAFNKIKGCKVVGICGKDSERMTNYCKKFGVNRYTNWQEMLEKENPVANRKGFSHIAFEVENVYEIVEKIKSLGGNMLGEIVKREISKVGIITFVYATDLEGNIIEVQNNITL